MRTSLPSVVLSILVLSRTTALPAADQAHTGGDCGAFEWDMTRELELMRGAPAAFAAATAADPGARLAPLEQRLDLTLRSAAQVKLQVAPRREAAPDSYAGLVRLRVPRAGTYRVSASERLWIEMVGPAGAVKSSKFTGRSGCGVLHKSVAFPLDGETDYWIELSGSPKADPLLLVTPDR